ncbi:MAG TPA: hypothetical protein VJ931_12695 [Actinomycetota bacterium]|nr:hypothetical protein [Actinomycetota bacterium]
MPVMRRPPSLASQVFARPEEARPPLEFDAPPGPESAREQLYQYYLGASRQADPAAMYSDAWNRALQDREGLDPTERPIRRPNPSLALRDVEHALASQVGRRTGRYGGYGGVMPVPPVAAVPTYNALKWLAQTEPRVVGRLLDAIPFTDIPQQFTGATPPSWRAVQWGLRPYLRGE